MNTRRLRTSLWRHDRGATVVEFALVAPLFLTALLGMIEGARALWMRQALQQTAFSAARCYALQEDCKTQAGTKTWAQTFARKMGVRITQAQVTEATRPTTCTGGGTIPMTRVRISVPFNSPATGFVPAAWTTVAASSCFPNPA
ncbi:TadE/TadG family type IV pilus assembly protein [Sphingomonas sp. ID0503]|uniref:TadE/TadG family type IV pilus assembly protein n=1 Tax=Sphingomonas sp. ID0503 TaxID=3399691 RepID=UPI003AFB04CD